MSPTKLAPLQRFIVLWSSGGCGNFEWAVAQMSFLVYRVSRLIFRKSVFVLWVLAYSEMRREFSCQFENVIMSDEFVFCDLFLTVMRVIKFLHGWRLQLICTARPNMNFLVMWRTNFFECNFFCGLRGLKIEKKARNEMHSIVFKRQVLLFSKTRHAQ